MSSKASMSSLGSFIDPLAAHSVCNETSRLVTIVISASSLANPTGLPSASARFEISGLCAICLSVSPQSQENLGRLIDLGCSKGERTHVFHALCLAQQCEAFCASCRASFSYSAKCEIKDEAIMAVRWETASEDDSSSSISADEMERQMIEDTLIVSDWLGLPLEERGYFPLRIITLVGEQSWDERREDDGSTTTMVYENGNILACDCYFCMTMNEETEEPGRECDNEECEVQVHYKDRAQGYESDSVYCAACKEDHELCFHCLEIITESEGLSVQESVYYTPDGVEHTTEEGFPFIHERCAESLASLSSSASFQRAVGLGVVQEHHCRQYAGLIGSYSAGAP
mmetsp:Transcript_60178/g.165355  ORF Transcript_60178/g.165355 Transcript_60178/m.165355 type:complete len:343 (+) Transcript_60178:163-1191(+)